MYFKVRCLREPLRVAVALLAFLCPFSLLIRSMRPLVYRLFSTVLEDDWNLLLSVVGAGIVAIAVQIPLQFYKVYEFTNRELQVLWWYGGWMFYFSGLVGGTTTRRKQRPRKNESPLLQRDEEEPLRGYPDEFEPALIQEQLARGALPDSVLGTSRTVRTVPRGELYDVKILESVFGATLLLRLQGCGEFNERFVWQYRLHNRGRLFVIRLSKARGEEAWAIIKEYTRR